MRCRPKPLPPCFGAFASTSAACSLIIAFAVLVGSYCPRIYTAYQQVTCSVVNYKEFSTTCVNTPCKYAYVVFGVSGTDYTFLAFPDYSTTSDPIENLKRQYPIGWTMPECYYLDASPLEQDSCSRAEVIYDSKDIKHARDSLIAGLIFLVFGVVNLSIIGIWSLVHYVWQKRFPYQQIPDTDTPL